MGLSTPPRNKKKQGGAHHYHWLSWLVRYGEAREGSHRTTKNRRERPNVRGQMGLVRKY